MAVRFDAAADQLSRTSDHVPSYDPITWATWLYVVSHQVCLVGGLYNGTGTEYSVVGLSAGGVLTLTTVGGSPTGTTLNTGQWYHLAYVRNGSSHIVYLDGVADITHTDSAAVTPSAQVYGSNTANNVNGRMTALKCWAAALSADEVVREMRQYRPIRLGNLHYWWPLLSHADVNDHSGNGRTAGVGGTLTTEDGPPIPWRAGKPRILLPEPQRARPTSDVTDGSWTTDTGGTALAAAIDEALPPSDSDYIQSALAPATDTAEVALGTLTDPSRSDGHVVRYRAVKPATGRQIDLTVRLMQGATEIAAWTTTDLATTIALTQQALTTGQADAITNYADLRLRFVANQPAADPVAPTYVGVGTAAAVASGDYAPSWPTGGAAPVANDIAILVGVQRDNVAESLPGGWAQIYSVNEGTTTRAWAYWFRCAGGESGTVTVTRAAGNTGYARIILIRGCPTSGSPIDASGTSGNTSNSTTITAPSITPTQANDLLLLVAHAADNGTNGVFGGTNPTPTEQFDTNTASGNDAGLALCSGVVPNTSATGSRTSTYTLSQRHVGATIAIKGAYASDARARVTWAELEVPAASGPGSTTLLTAAALVALFPAAVALTPGAMTLALAAAPLPRPASASAATATATIAPAATPSPAHPAAPTAALGTTLTTASAPSRPPQPPALLAAPGSMTLAPTATVAPVPPAALSLTASLLVAATGALLPSTPTATSVAASATAAASAALPPAAPSGVAAAPGTTTLLAIAAPLPPRPSALLVTPGAATLAASAPTVPARPSAPMASPGALTLTAASALAPSGPPALATTAAALTLLVAATTVPERPAALIAAPGLTTTLASAALTAPPPAALSLTAMALVAASAAHPPPPATASTLSLAPVTLLTAAALTPRPPIALLVAPGALTMALTPVLAPAFPGAVSAAIGAATVLAITGAPLPAAPLALALAPGPATLSLAATPAPAQLAALALAPLTSALTVTPALLPPATSAPRLFVATVVLPLSPVAVPAAPSALIVTAPGQTTLAALVGLTEVPTSLVALLAALHGLASPLDQSATLAALLAALHGLASPLDGPVALVALHDRPYLGG